MGKPIIVCTRVHKMEYLFNQKSSEVLILQYGRTSGGKKKLY